MTQHKIGPVSPLFIVRDAQESADYYVESLGFELRVLQPEDEPFFAMVGRDSTQLLLKAVSDTVLAQPNCTRYEWPPWVHSCIQSPRLSCRKNFRLEVR